MKRRDLIKKLKANGFSKIRDDGNHTIYKAPNKPCKSQGIVKLTKTQPDKS